MSTILILHGWGSCAARWQKVKELLEKKGLKVFVPDLPGFGQEPPPATAWNIDNYVEWVRDFAGKNNLSRFFLSGHSFGGSVAAKYSLRYPENIEKLFLASSAGIRKKTGKKEFFKKISPLFRSFSLLRRIFYRFFIKSDYQYTSGVMRKTYLNVINEDISELFSQIKVPTVVIWGEKDDITPIADAYFINKEIKNSKLEIIPGIGHRIRLEAPEILVEKILTFINEDKKEYWNDFLIKNKGSFLQSFEWGELQEKVERLEISKGGKKLLQAQIIKEKVPFFPYFYIPYGPVFSQNISLEEKKESFIALVETIAKKEKAVFLRLEPSVSLPETDIFNSKTALRRIQPKKTLILNLEKPEEEILESIHKKTKYNIKLAERKGVKVRVLDDYSNVFFNLLKKTRERQNFISYSEERYKKLFKINSKDFKVKMFLVEYQNKVIVASIIVFFGDRATSLHTGSDHEYRALKGPDLLRWEVIAYSKRLGYKVYDFWGIDDEKFPGVSNFKRGFGGMEIEYPVGIDIIFNNAQYQIYRVMRKIKHGF